MPLFAPGAELPRPSKPASWYGAGSAPVAAGLVLNARRRRITRDVLAGVLDLSPETARRSYHERLIEHQLAQHIALTSAPGPGEKDDKAPAPPPVRSSRRASSRLAPILSELQRASGTPLRQLGLRVRVSASYLSRIMSGEAFPTLDLTERIGQALGADPQLLHTIWTAEKDRQHTHGHDSTSSSPSLAAADQLLTSLRALQRRSMVPSLHRLAATTGGLLSERDVDRILRGEQIGDWLQIQHMVQALDGEPRFFRALWERATHEARAAGPALADSPDNRVTRLLTAFGRTLSDPETDTRAPNTRAPRRQLRAQVIRNRIALARTI